MYIFIITFKIKLQLDHLMLYFFFKTRKKFYFY